MNKQTELINVGLKHDLVRELLKSYIESDWGIAVSLRQLNLKKYPYQVVREVSDRLKKGFPIYARYDKWIFYRIESPYKYQMIERLTNSHKVVCYNPFEHSTTTCFPFEMWLRSDIEPITEEEWNNLRK